MDFVCKIVSNFWKHLCGRGDDRLYKNYPDVIDNKIDHVYWHNLILHNKGSIASLTNNFEKI